MSVSDSSCQLWSPPGAEGVFYGSAMLATAVGLGGMCLWKVGVGLVEPWLSSPVDVLDVLEGLGMAAVFLLGSGICGFFGHVLLDGLRKQYWLDGTVLTQQRGVRKLQLDLSTARVRTEFDSRWSKPTQYMKLRAPESGTEVKLPVVENGRVMAKSDMFRVADALTAGRDCAGSGRYAFVVADRLRRLAVDPRTRIDREEPAESTEEAGTSASDDDGKPSTSPVKTVFQAVGTFAVLSGMLIAFAHYVLELDLFALAA